MSVIPIGPYGLRRLTPTTIHRERIGGACRRSRSNRNRRVPGDAAVNDHLRYVELRTRRTGSHCDHHLQCREQDADKDVPLLLAARQSRDYAVKEWKVL